MSAVTLSQIVELAGGRLDETDFPSNLDLSHVELLRSPSGALIIADIGVASGDSIGDSSADSMAAALKMLVQLSGETGRSIAILGELDVPAGEANDEHDRIGRLVVRLNVQKLIVVGHGARHIHNAAGLEGSWDGESELVASPDEAYDLLREDLGQEDIVLVKSSAAAGLGALAHRLSGVLK
jgi:UDP-N-acetylmuramoyl-tripeptide--D-alanyl-D-alanine ligase